jgi:hypothetical protein
VKIIFRGDRGFCRWRLMRWCDRRGVDYILGLAKNARLKRLARRPMVTARWRHRRTRQKQRLFDEFAYAAESWDRPRRVIAKAEHDDRGANPRFIVTSLPGDPQTLYEHLYCQRGDGENRIKEQQLGLFADRTSAATLRANQLRLYFACFAYVLLYGLRRLGLQGSALARAQCTTIRLKLLKIGARVKITVRKVWLSFSESYPYARDFAQILVHLQGQPLWEAPG